MCRVAALLLLVRGPGLACDAPAHDPGARRGSAGLHRRFEHLAHRPRRLRAQHAAARRRHSRLHQRKRDEVAVAGEDRISACELEQADRDAVTVRHGRLFDRAPGLRVAHLAGGFTGKPELRRDAETESPVEFVHLLPRQRQRDLCRADVGRLLDDLRGRERAGRMRIVDRVARDRERARGGLNDRLRRHPAKLHCERHGKRLQRGAGLEQIGNDAIAQLRAAQFRAVVRVVGRDIGKRQHLSAACVERDHRAGLRPVRFHRVPQRSEREALDLAVDREPQILAVLRGAHRFDVLDHMTEPVLDHAPAARAAGEAGLKCELHALLPGVLDAGEPDHVRGRFAARVVTAELAVLVQAGNAQLRHARRRLGRNLAPEVDEVLRIPGQLLLELARHHVEERGKPLPLRWRSFHVLGNRPNRLHRRRDREGVAVAVEDPAARGGHFEQARVARVALFLQESGFQRLQVDRARNEHAEGGEKREQHEACAPDRQAHQRGRGRGAHWRAAASRSSITRTRRGSGARRPRVPEAILSTRACSPQVLDSSCSCPYSISSSRARPCSASSREKSLRAWCWEVTSPSAQTRRTRRRRRFSFATRRARFGIEGVDPGVQAYVPPRARRRCARAGWIRLRRPRGGAHGRRF